MVSQKDRLLRDGSFSKEKHISRKVVDFIGNDNYIQIPFGYV